MPEEKYLAGCVDTLYKLIAPQGKLAMAKLVLLSRQHKEPTVGEDALYAIIRQPRRYAKLTSAPVREAVSLALEMATEQGVILPYRKATMTSDPDAVDTVIVQFGAWCYVDMVSSILSVYMRFLDSQLQSAAQVFDLPSSMSRKDIKVFLDNRLREELKSNPFLASSSHLVYPALDLIS